MLEPQQVAQAYARWIADGEPDFQAMMSPDLRDHVSGQPGPETWDIGLGLDRSELRGAESGAAWLGHPR
jgi:hypothetical protein